MQNKGYFMKNNLLLLGLFVMVMAGCATSARYISYTTQQFPPKDKMYAISVYPSTQAPAVSNPYYVIGKVSIEGFASSGVNPDSLTNQAKEIARKRGADGIINARTEIIPYYGGDELLRFKGELIVYSPVVVK